MNPVTEIIINQQTVFHQLKDKSAVFSKKPFAENYVIQFYEGKKLILTQYIDSKWSPKWIYEAIVKRISPLKLENVTIKNQIPGSKNGLLEGIAITETQNERRVYRRLTPKQIPQALKSYIS